MIIDGEFYLLFSIIDLLRKKKSRERKGDKENEGLNKKDPNNLLEILKLYKEWKTSGSY